MRVAPEEVFVYLSSYLFAPMLDHGHAVQNPLRRATAKLLAAQARSGFGRYAAIGRLKLRASRRLFFIGVFYRILDFITSLLDLLPGFFYRLIDLLAGALRRALIFLAGE
jgi:hypothetical protein